MSKETLLQFRNDWLHLLRPKLKRSTSENPSHHALSQAELMGWLINQKHEGIVSRASGVFLPKNELETLLEKLFDDAKSFDDFVRQHRFLSQIISYGRKNLGWKIPPIPALYKLPRVIPLLTEQDALELASLRALEGCVERSFDDIKTLSVNARFGQIYYSAIVNGGLLVPWKVNALHSSGINGLVVEEFGIWFELKEPEKKTKKKNSSEISGLEVSKSRWIPDPVTELLLLKGLEDEIFGQIQPELNAWKCIAELFASCGVPKELLESSSKRRLTLHRFCKWASQGLALRIPPYMRDTLKNKHVSTCVSSETFLRLYSGNPVKKHDSSIPVRNKIIRRRQGINNLKDGVFPLSEQFEFLNQINLQLKQFSQAKSKKELRRLVTNEKSVPGYLCWLITLFCHKLVTKGGLVKENITNSTVRRYLSAIKTPVLNAFADHDARELNGYDWIELLQSAIDDRSDQLSCNRIAEFGLFVSQLEDTPDFDIKELDGIAINKIVNANLVTPQEFDKTMLHFPVSNRENRMQRLVAALSFYCGLRRGEAVHIMLSDVAGRSDTELLVRSNKYYKTKNKKSRRIPLARLLPRTWLDEFMAFYDERLDEDGGKLNGLLFCSFGARKHPLNPSVLIDRFMDQLKLETGDDTLVFHSLRHSFANWMLIRLLLPEYPQIRHDKFKLFEHDIFDLNKASAFRSQLLSSAANRVDVSVRDVLSQIANYMGHSGPDITLRSYLHLFDWIISRCLLASNRSMSDSQVRELLSLQGSNWYKKKHKFDLLDGHVVINDNVLSIARKQHREYNVNPAKEKVIIKRGKRRAPQAKCRPIKVNDLVHVLPMLFETGSSVEDAASRHHLSVDDVIRVKNNAEALYRVEGIGGEPRFQFVPKSLRGKHNIDDRDLMLRNCHVLRKNDRRIRAWLERVMENESNSSGIEALFKTPTEANEFISLLCELKIPKTRILIWYYPDSNASEVERDEALKQWSQATGVKSDHIIPRHLWNEVPNQRPGGLGRVSVFVREKKSDNNRRSSGVQAALHYIAVHSFQTSLSV